MFYMDEWHEHLLDNCSKFTEDSAFSFIKIKETTYPYRMHAMEQGDVQAQAFVVFLTLVFLFLPASRLNNSTRVLGTYWWFLNLVLIFQNSLQIHIQVGLYWSTSPLFQPSWKYMTLWIFEEAQTPVPSHVWNRAWNKHRFSLLLTLYVPLCFWQIYIFNISQV